MTTKLPERYAKEVKALMAERKRSEAISDNYTKTGQHESAERVDRYMAGLEFALNLLGTDSEREASALQTGENL